MQIGAHVVKVQILEDMVNTVGIQAGRAALVAANGVTSFEQELCQIGTFVPDIKSCFHSLGSAVVVGKPHDIVFTQITARLNLDHLKVGFSGVFQAMCFTNGNVG